MVWVLFVLLSTLHVHAANTRLDKLTEAAMGLLEESNLGVNIRQCSCNEDADCVKVMQSQTLLPLSRSLYCTIRHIRNPYSTITVQEVRKLNTTTHALQAKECADSCWDKFSEVNMYDRCVHTDPELREQSQHSARTKRCAGTVPELRDQYERSLSCVDSPTGPQVPKVDLRKLFDSLEQKVLASRAELLSQGLVAGMKPIAEAAVKFGTCVKQCFVYKKNSEGFCYDGKGCQPSITQKNLRTSLRICLAQTGWKSHAYDLCECARKAGVEGLDDVCSLLNTIRGSKHS